MKASVSVARMWESALVLSSSVVMEVTAAFEIVIVCFTKPTMTLDMITPPTTPALKDSAARLYDTADPTKLIRRTPFLPMT
mmetsp:Transcript_24574/g.60371  ORF Transcript_24574/g.60371 Transcript_24574/m.60371 type:complete len:81 (+) Transcript_24574:949-1191(+)